MSTTQPADTTATNLAAITKRIKTLGKLGWVKAGEGINSPVESYICDPCSKLDLRVESFLVGPNDNERERSNRFRYLGRLSQIQQRTHCPFCRLILEIADRPADQRSPSSVSAEDPVCYARWIIDGQEDLGPNPKNPSEHIYKPKTRRLLIYSDPQAFKDGYIVLLADDAPMRDFFGRKITSPDLLDPEQLKKWIYDCESTHGQECEESLVHPDLLGEPKTIFRAIDVKQMCIVEAPRNARYVALSYLWGRNFAQLFTTSKNLARLSEPGALAKEKLPRTIKDTIKLCNLIGERYLWTDSLALIHDDGFQYHDDWVYARAALTVVAGSGKDANAGLPGVRKESRTFHQLIEEVKPGLRLMVSHLAEDYISTSQWDSRAWTYQERMLSRRCLLFVNGRIYYQCRRTTFCEDMEMPRINGWSLDSIDMPTRIFREKPFVQFTSAVELYTRRDLTNPNDILNAFEGMQLVLEKRLDCQIYYGLLEHMMDSSLLWESTKRLYRRSGYPSWSWSGWYGEIQWKLTEPVQSWIEWHVDLPQGIHKFPHQLTKRIEPPVPRSGKNPVQVHHSSKITPLLHFQTISAFFALMSPVLIHKSIISPLRKRLTGPSALSTVRPAPADPGLVRAGIADRNDQWCGTIDLDAVYLNRVGAPLEFLLLSKIDSFSDDELAIWEGILPDVIEDELATKCYGVYVVLLVSKQDGVYYREGLGRILASSLNRALNSGPAWTDVILG